MRQFYEQWSMLTNRQPMAGDLDLMDFFALGFTLHMEILAKTQTLEERVFYIRQCAVDLEPLDKGRL